MLLPILLLGVLSFSLSWIATLIIKNLAPRFGFVDKPGHRKIHSNPKPLGGGIAVFLAIFLPLLAILAFAWVGPAPARPDWLAYVGGIRKETPLAIGILGAMLLMHLLGL